VTQVLTGGFMENFRTYQLAIIFFKECEKIKLKGPAKNQFERAA
jgi:hypothetical protein